MGKFRRKINAITAAVMMTIILSGCVSFPDWLSSSGPARGQVSEVPQQTPSAIRLVDVDDAVTQRILQLGKRKDFSEIFSTIEAKSYTIGPGDLLEVSIWEAPPATLFGVAVIDPRAGINSARATALPEQMVEIDGSINVPFAGVIAVAGKSPKQIEAEIAKNLRGKANQPQVLVRVTRHTTSSVTVVGEVAQSIRMPLTPKGERLLDAVAAAGGVRQPVGKTTVQLTRGNQVTAMPLDAIIQDPMQNIVLRPGDVVTALHQSLSLTILGATGKNEEMPFEANGITLAQAIARAGGLQDSRADARGVFIFRLEEAIALAANDDNALRTPDNKVPVVYRVDLKDPRSFFVAQSFPMRNKDVIYVANAPAAELQKFLNIVTSSLFSVSSLRGLVTQQP